MRRPLALMLLLSMSVLMPSVAGAHGGATSGTNYESNVLTTPAGIAARMVGGDDRLLITRIDRDFEGDRFFPADWPRYFTKLISSKKGEYLGLGYAFEIWER